MNKTIAMGLILLKYKTWREESRTSRDGGGGLGEQIALDLDLHTKGINDTVDVQ